MMKVDYTILLPNLLRDARGTLGFRFQNRPDLAGTDRTVLKLVTVPVRSYRTACAAETCDIARFVALQRCQVSTTLRAIHQLKKLEARQGHFQAGAQTRMPFHK